MESDNPETQRKRAVPLHEGERVIPFQLISPDDEQIGIIVTRRKLPLRELGTFTMVSRSYLERLLMDESFRVGSTVFAVLLVMLAKVDYDNTWVASSDDIASQVGRTDRSVRQAIQTLRARGLLVKLAEANVKGAAGHMLNPFFAARGKGHSVRALQQKWTELQRVATDAAKAA